MPPPQAILARAWALLQEPAFREVRPRLRMLWLHVVLDIHQYGDGVAIHFGEPGDRYRSLAHFLSTHERTEADLAALIGDGWLLRLKQGQIAIPDYLGLEPRRKPRPPKRVPFAPKLIAGGRP
jgi:hypothetical protein